MQNIATKKGRPPLGKAPLTDYERDLRRRTKAATLHLEMRSYIVRSLHDRRGAGEDVRSVIDGFSTPLRAELAQAACSVARLHAMEGKLLGNWPGLLVALVGDKPLPDFLHALPPAGEDASAVRHGFMVDGEEIPF